MRPAIGQPVTAQPVRRATDRLDRSECDRIHASADDRVRPRRRQKNTMPCCAVAELADDLDPSALDACLLVVQRRHPLLNVFVEDHPQTGLGFRRPTCVPPIPVSVVDAGTGHAWCDVVAAELTRPFDLSSAPMIRVVLLGSGPTTSAATVLTVADVIVDGLSAGYVLRSLLRCCGVQPRRLSLYERQHPADRGGDTRAEESPAAGERVGPAVTPARVVLAEDDVLLREGLAGPPC
jgi:hypothetical protein